MNDPKLSVVMLDNLAESAVINIGNNSGYIEANISDGVLYLCVYARNGDIVHEYQTNVGAKR